MLEQDLAFVLVHAVQRGGEHDLGPGEIQAEGQMIAGGRSWDMAVTDGKTQVRGISGDQPEACQRGK
ncbi:hypothetical protein [Cupriavidus basilensis]|uniref:hypothetical protein n=1 Tax=Cupriavidus basilensis TaxID=68895 RepID=UPI00157B5FD6|nr:hypothetical protein [Cupriavidus basilensis]